MCTLNHQSTHSPKVLVCQRGARHRYAIPRLFEEAGLLVALYTDSTALSPMGKLAWISCQMGFKHGNVLALSSRVPKGIPRQKVFSTDRLLYSAIGKGRLASDLSPVYRKWGLQEADVVYSMYGEDLSFLKWAKSQGAKIIVDIFISPLANQMVFDEQGRFDNVPAGKRIKGSDCRCSEERGIGALAPVADILLCPSDWVADGVRRFVPAHAHKIRVVPYGSSVSPREQKEVVPGRILFAGRDPLRKGLPYLAEAVSNLRESGMRLEARVAGLSASDCRWVPHHEELNFLGVVKMDRMGSEYERADIFVLPSLAEGQAGVVLEALSYGCPVVSTRESGVDFSSYENGVLVDACSTGQIESAIAKLVSDRGLRDRIALNGKQYFEREFSVRLWRERLCGIVEELCR